MSFSVYSRQTFYCKDPHALPSTIVCLFFYVREKCEQLKNVIKIHSNVEQKKLTTLEKAQQERKYEYIQSIWKIIN